MGYQLTKLGREYIAKNDVDGATWTIGLYNDDIDQITYQHDLYDDEDNYRLTTEPDDGNYATQDFTVEIAEGVKTADCRNSAKVTFDLTNTTGTVKSYYIKVSFTSDFAGDSESTEHLIATGRLKEKDNDGNVVDAEIDCSDESEFEIEAGFAGVKI